MSPSNNPLRISQARLSAMQARLSTMSPSNSPLRRTPLAYRTPGFPFNIFGPRQDMTVTNNVIASDSTEQTTREVTPEWYYEPGSLDHLNPNGVRPGAAWPTGSTSTSLRSEYGSSDDSDSIPANTDRSTKSDAVVNSVEATESTTSSSVEASVRKPLKRRLADHTDGARAKARRVLPALRQSWHASSLNLRAMAERNQSEAVLSSLSSHTDYQLDVDIDETPFSDLWTSAGFEMSQDQNVALPQHSPSPIHVPGPGLIAVDRTPSAVRWWEPSPRRSDALTVQGHYQAYLSFEQTLELAAESLPPLMPAPAGPRLEGENRDGELDVAMGSLEI